MKPSFLNLFMEWLTRWRVAPMMSAGVSWLIGVVVGCGTASLPCLEVTTVLKFVRALVAQTGGTLRIDRGGQCQGTRFTVAFA
jgi:hypothetical protein